MGKYVNICSEIGPSIFVMNAGIFLIFLSSFNFDRPVYSVKRSGKSSATRCIAFSRGFNSCRFCVKFVESVRSGFGSGERDGAGQLSCSVSPFLTPRDFSMIRS